MTRHRICSTDELAEGERLLKQVRGREIAVFHTRGEYVAVANYCVHAGGPVCEGRLSGTVSADSDRWDWEWEREDEILTCPWHGWEFDVFTGEFLSDDRYRLVTYDVEIEDGDLFVVTDRARRAEAAEGGAEAATPSEQDGAD